MNFVRACTSGPWRTIDLVDVHGQKYGEKYLVMAAEKGRWSINNAGIDVQPGLCVSFRDADDANWFLQQRRAQYVSVEPGSVVAFFDEGDANFYCSKGLAEMMREREVQEFFQQQTGGEVVDDDIEPEPESEVATQPARRGRPKKNA